MRVRDGQGLLPAVRNTPILYLFSATRRPPPPNTVFFPPRQNAAGSTFSIKRITPVRCREEKLHPILGHPSIAVNMGDARLASKRGAPLLWSVLAAVVTSILTCLALRQQPAQCAGAGESARLTASHVAPAGAVNTNNPGASLEEPWSQAPEDVVMPFQLPTWAWCTRPGYKYSRLAEATVDPNTVRASFEGSGRWHDHKWIRSRTGLVRCNLQSGCFDDRSRRRSPRAQVYATHSQDGEETWVYDNLFFNKVNGTFMEMGALDGVELSSERSTRPRPANRWSTRCALDPEVCVAC